MIRPDADRIRSFGDRKFLGGPDQPLNAFDHEHDRLLAAFRAFPELGRQRVACVYRADEDVHLLAALTGVVILVAFAVQVMTAR